MFLIYSLIYMIVTAVLLPFEYLKRPKEVRQRWLREKFGFFNSELSVPNCETRTLYEPLAPSHRPNSQLIWVHAVSMGEVISAVPFIKELASGHPSAGIILSTITDTGQKVAKERLSGIAAVVYLPLDISLIFKKVLKRIRPDLFITVETELWPNIFRILEREGIPVVVVNGRISEGSFKGYNRIRGCMKDVLQGVGLFCMQDRIYAERIKMLGADRDRVKITGNFKFDAPPPLNVPEWTGLLKGPVIVAGSTHRTEEDLITGVYQELLDDFPDLNLIIAPRHPERFGEVEELLKKRELRYINKSKIMSDLGRITHDTRRTTRDEGHLVVLLDAVGELASVYGAADIAVIGGSFIRHGGQNPLEPAFWGKPVVCGPHMGNFPFMDEFYDAGGAKRVSNEELYGLLRGLLGSPDKRIEMGRKARAVYDLKAGAIKRTIGYLEGYLKS